LLDGFRIAQPAAELHWDTYSVDKVAKYFPIASVRLGKGAVQIDYVNYRSAISLKAFRDLDRIAIVDSSRLFPPLCETNAPALS
jgi:hypothetical protein